MATFKSSAKSRPSATASKSAASKKTAKPRTRKTARAPSSETSLGNQSIMDSAQQIWQTGITAFGRAQQEGTRLFETLVKEGSGIEKKTRNLAAGKVSAVRKTMQGSVETRVDQVKDRAADTWDRLEKLFEERVQRALNRLGVPGREELQALVDRVDELNARLRGLAGQTPATSRAATSKATSKATKTASKKASTKASASKPKAATAKPAVRKSSSKTATATKTASKAATKTTSRKPASKTVKTAASTQQTKVPKPAEKASPVVSETTTASAPAAETKTA